MNFEEIFKNIFSNLNVQNINPTNMQEMAKVAKAFGGMWKPFYRCNSSFAWIILIILFCCCCGGNRENSNIVCCKPVKCKKVKSEKTKRRDCNLNISVDPCTLIIIIIGVICSCGCNTHGRNPLGLLSADTMDVK